MKNKKILFVLVALLGLTSPLAPRALAVGESCDTRASECCTPPPIVVVGGGCDTGEYWIGDASTGYCRPSSTTCGAVGDTTQSFSCVSGACTTQTQTTTTPSNPLCGGDPNKVHLGGSDVNNCATKVNVIQDPSATTILKAWLGQALGKLVYIPESGSCATGQVPVWDSTGKTWACGQGDSLWKMGTGANANDIYKTNSGGVGIGTSTPTAMLDVIGSANISGNNTVLGQVTVGDGGGGDGLWINGGDVGYNCFSGHCLIPVPLNVSAGANTILRVNGISDNVGIGTDTPKGKLNVVATGGFGDEDGSGHPTSNVNVPIIAQTSIDSTFFGAINKDNRPAFAMNIENGGGTNSTRGTPVFYDKYDGSWHSSIALKNGNVGIGTSTPSSKLEVFLTSGAGGIKISGDATDGVHDSPSLTLAGKSIDGVTREGTFGLSLSDGHYSNDASQGDVVLRSKDSDIIFATTSPSYAPAMKITSDGKVGIGTKSPGYKLDVAGDAHVDQNIFLGTSNKWIFHNPNDGRTTLYLGPWGSSDWNWAAATEFTNTGDVTVKRNLKVGPFYFDGNDDTWMRVRDGDGGAYKDLAVGQLYSTSSTFLAQGGGDVSMLPNGGTLTIGSNYLANTLSYSGGLWTLHGDYLDASMRNITGTRIIQGEGIIAGNGPPAGCGWEWSNSGYSFSLDGCWDTGMFSQSDGVIDFWSNGHKKSSISQIGTFAFNSNQYSDQRIKENIQSFTPSLETIRQIRPVSFDYNGLGDSERGQRGIGVIAQELQTVLPEAIKTEKVKLHPDDKDYTDLLAVDQAVLPMVSINAIKELDSMAVKKDDQGSVSIGGDLKMDQNKWGAGSGWIECPETGECSCPDGLYMTRIENRGSRVFCNTL